MATDHEINVWVDQAVCVGSGPCFVIAPGAFKLDDNMKAIVLNPSCETRRALMDAAAECPAQAIYLSEHDKPLFP